MRIKAFDLVARLVIIDEIITEIKNTLAGLCEAFGQMLRTLNAKMPVNDGKEEQVAPVGLCDIDRSRMAYYYFPSLFCGRCHF